MIVVAQTQISNLYIEKTCKVGSYFFGNGTTYEDEVRKVEQSKSNPTKKSLHGPKLSNKQSNFC